MDRNYTNPNQQRQMCVLFFFDDKDSLLMEPSSLKHSNIIHATSIWSDIFPILSLLQGLYLLLVCRSWYVYSYLLVSRCI